jgi:hypothetical protein
LTPELQVARCMSNRYRNEDFPRCVSCTRRWAGDTCRFQGIRFFLKNPDKNIVGISFVESKADGHHLNFPVKWNVPLRLAYIDIIKVRFTFTMFVSYSYFKSENRCACTSTCFTTRSRTYNAQRYCTTPTGERSTCDMR